MYNNNNNLIFIMRLGNAMQTQRRMSLQIGKMHDQHLEAFAEKNTSANASRCWSCVAGDNPPAMHGIILNSHRVLSIATNISMVLNCALVTYIMMTADVGQHLYI